MVLIATTLRELELNGDAAMDGQGDGQTTGVERWNCVTVLPRVEC